MATYVRICAEFALKLGETNVMRIYWNLFGLVLADQTYHGGFVDALGSSLACYDIVYERFKSFGEGLLTAVLQFPTSQIHMKLRDLYLKLSLLRPEPRLNI